MAVAHDAHEVHHAIGRQPLCKRVSRVVLAWDSIHRESLLSHSGLHPGFPYVDAHYPVPLAD
eukprot:11042072-Heterocapsa_arctica.AAC.1